MSVTSPSPHDPMPDHSRMAHGVTASETAAEASMRSVHSARSVTSASSSTAVARVVYILYTCPRWMVGQASSKLVAGSVVVQAMCSFVCLFAQN